MRRRWLVLGVGVLALLGMAIAMYPGHRGPPNPAAKVSPGMARHEVWAVLLEEPGLKSPPAVLDRTVDGGPEDPIQERWPLPDGTIVVQYDAAKRVQWAEFESNDRPPTFLDRLRRLLPW
jgi:hypothetical protein